MQVIIVGGGFAGCAAALEAAKLGAKTFLLERTDMLCGTGAVGGIMRNNGRYTAAEEMIAMGGGEIFGLLDENSRHTNVSFPGHVHASLFDVAKVPAKMERFLEGFGVQICKETRISAVHMKSESAIESVRDDRGKEYEGDVFIDATGTAGPAAMCHKYGKGCAMCIMRCPSFGGRVSLSALCGVHEFAAIGNEQESSGIAGQYGAMSGSCKLMKGSLSMEMQQKLEHDGVCVVPLPPELVQNHLAMKACQQYALPEFAENIILLDTGHAKLMAPFFPLDKLRQVRGLENARFEDPYAGGTGNSVRFTAMVHRDHTMKVKGIKNLFCAGEKSGIFVGHTEAIVTGTLAGYNSVCFGKGRKLLELPEECVCGDAIRQVGEQMESEQGKRRKYTFSGSVLFEHMCKRGLYTTDTSDIVRRIRRCGMENIFSAPEF